MKVWNYTLNLGSFCTSWLWNSRQWPWKTAVGALLQLSFLRPVNFWTWFLNTLFDENFFSLRFRGDILDLKLFIYFFQLCHNFWFGSLFRHTPALRLSNDWLDEKFAQSTILCPHFILIDYLVVSLICLSCQVGLLVQEVCRRNVYRVARCGRIMSLGTSSWALAHRPFVEFVLSASFVNDLSLEHVIYWLSLHV